MKPKPDPIIPLKQMKITDDYWRTYTDLVHDTVIPYQWEALNDRIPGAEPSHAIQNFKIAAGLEDGQFQGMVFQDSDLAKWLEAVGYDLVSHPNLDLERLADEAIDLIARAQEEDGYLNTYYSIKEPGKRWTNLNDCHELYCAGHMIEAAVAYYKATGKRKLLDVMCRFVDHIDSIFGPEPEKIQGYDGHQEIELALVKLYKVTGDEKHLRLSQFFIDERGQKPNFFIDEWEKRGRTSHWRQGKAPAPDLKYNQSHVPVREQTVAVGHAVRAVYMYTAMADLARLTDDKELLAACRRIWNNIALKQMYITGGIGSTHHGEAFSFDYDLPNDTVYAETCASIGLIFFAQRMLHIEPKTAYADVLERALYNNVVGSMSLDGKHYFYVNPLEVWPEASEKNPGKHHVKPVRQKWFGCSCCPPNVARLLSSLGEYIYTVEKDTIYTHLYIGSETAVEVEGTPAKIQQQSNLPWNGSVTFKIHTETKIPFTMALRIPGWCSENPVLRINGQPTTFSTENGYAHITRIWNGEDTIEWVLPMDVQLIEAHPEIRANAGKVAFQRGPLMYCLEEVDNVSPISSISIDPQEKFTARFDPKLLGGAVVIEGEGYADHRASWGDAPYRLAAEDRESIPIKAIPYNLWGNRESGEMSVWVRKK